MHGKTRPSSAERDDMERLTTIALGLLSSIVFLVRDDKGLFLRIGLADTSVHRSIGRSSVRVSAELDFFF